MRLSRKPSIQAEQVAANVRNARVQNTKVKTRSLSEKVLSHNSKRGVVEPGNIYSVPENWYEPTGNVNPMEYTIYEYPAGNGFRHAATSAEVEDRLLELPEHIRAPVEVIELAQQTKKKAIRALYGQQWGNAVYLYPIEDTLVEEFDSRVLALEQDTKKFGGKWSQEGELWRLTWTPESIRDYYLENVLIHEIGHVHDKRNKNYNDRERFADAFANKHGKPTFNLKKRVYKRHNAV